MSANPLSQSQPARLGGDHEARPMRFHVTWRVFDSIQHIDDVARMQRTVIAVMERCAGSNLVMGHGMFADCRGGFVIADVETPERLLELFAGLQDVAHLEVHPLARTDLGLRHLRGMLASEQLG